MPGNVTVTVTGNLSASANDATLEGSVDVMLCGYGSQVPRINGQSLVGRITTSDIQAVNGIFEFQVAGNDLISPAGTYYTVTIRGETGDIVQVNAYRFLGTTPTYDLNLTDPYDPNQPPPPVPPLITNLLLVVPWSPTMQFPGDLYTSFRTTLTGDVTSTTAPDTIQGNLYTFIIQQDAIGGHLFTWPTNSINASPINPDPNSVTVQTFVMGLQDLIPIGAATWWG